MSLNIALGLPEIFCLIPELVNHCPGAGLKFTKGQIRPDGKKQGLIARYGLARGKSAGCLEPGCPRKNYLGCPIKQG